MWSGRLSSAVHPSRSNASRIRAHASPGCSATKRVSANSGTRRRYALSMCRAISPPQSCPFQTSATLRSRIATGCNPGCKLSATESNSGQLKRATQSRTALRCTGTLRLGAGRSQVQILSPRCSRKARKTRAFRLSDAVSASARWGATGVQLPRPRRLQDDAGLRATRRARTRSRWVVVAFAIEDRRAGRHQERSPRGRCQPGWSRSSNIR
jgi:hypothetical protein